VVKLRTHAVGTLQTGYPCAQDLKDQPHDSRSVLGARRLWLRHVPRGTEHATRQKRALMSPCAPWHRACHPPGKGSCVAMCLEAPCAPLARRGPRCYHVPQGTEPIPGRRRLRSHHTPHGSRPAPYAGRLERRHVTKAPGPPPDRAPVPRRVLWLQTCFLVCEGSGAAMCRVALGPWVYPSIPKTLDIRPIMASLGTRCRQRIKCICDRP
jgi:hypothetical protein